MEYDYSIVGGGPAGTVTAYCLQKRGVKCAILEKREQIDEKICGGLLTWSGIKILKEIGLDVTEFNPNDVAKIKQYKYVFDKYTRTYRYHNEEYGIGIRREIFDKWLMDKAVTEGADVFYGIKFSNVAYQNNMFKVGDILAQKLIIATGAMGFVPLAMRGEIKHQTFGLSMQIRGRTLLDEETAYFFFIGENKLDYFWIIPNGNGVWNIGIWFHKMSKNVVIQFGNYNDYFMDKYFTDISIVRKLKGAYCGNVNFSTQLSQDVYGVGDFTGTNNRKTGEGLRYAIESAVHVVRSLNL